MSYLPQHPLPNFAWTKPPETADRPFLEENYWWWNWKILGKRQPPSKPLRGLGASRMENAFFDMEAWNDSDSRIAWCYELLMRHDRHIPFPAYYDLNGQERHFLREAFDPVEPVYLEYGGLSSLRENSEIGWTNSRSRMQWNLRKSDHALTKAFLKYIHHYRERQGITVPKKNTGRKQHKRPVWRTLELLDLNFYHLETFGEGERSQISKAKRKAGAFYRRFVEQWRGMSRADLSNAGCFESLMLPK